MFAEQHKKLRMIIGVASVLGILVSTFILLPWLVDTVMLRWQLGLEILVASSAPWLLAICVMRFSGIDVPTPKPEVRKFNPLLILFGVILIFAARIVLMPLENLVPAGVNDYFEENTTVLLESGIWPMVAWIICIPVLSEWVLRGVVQSNLTRVVGIYWAVLITSLVYGLIFIGRGEVFMGFATSLVLGSIFFLTHSLSTVIAVHFLFNGFAYLYYLLFGVSGVLEDFITGSADVFVMIWTGCLVVLVWTGWWVRRHDKNRKLAKALKNRRNVSVG